MSKFTGFKRIPVDTSNRIIHIKFKHALKKSLEIVLIGKNISLINSSVKNVIKFSFSKWNFAHFVFIFRLGHLMSKWLFFGKFEFAVDRTGRHGAFGDGGDDLPEFIRAGGDIACSIDIFNIGRLRLINNNIVLFVQFDA